MKKKPDFSETSLQEFLDMPLQEINKMTQSEARECLREVRKRQAELREEQRRFEQRRKGLKIIEGEVAIKADAPKLPAPGGKGT